MNKKTVDKQYVATIPEHRNIMEDTTNSDRFKGYVNDLNATTNMIRRVSRSDDISGDSCYSEPATTVIHDLETIIISKEILLDALHQQTILCLSCIAELINEDNEEEYGVCNEY